VKLAFCRYLPREARLSILERRRTQLADRLDRAQRVLRTQRDRRRPEDHYARSLVEHGTKTAAHDLQWVDELIAAERAATAPEGASAGPPSPGGNTL
jgi:hypothetical protein